jgi:hypothetical protein
MLIPLVPLLLLHHLASPVKTTSGLLNGGPWRRSVLGRVRACRAAIAAADRHHRRWRSVQRVGVIGFVAHRAALERLPQLVQPHSCWPCCRPKRQQ